MPLPPPVLVLGIDHVGVAVSDLDEAIDRHHRLFGLVVAAREANPHQGVEEAMLVPSADAAATPLQLLAPLSPDSPVGRFLQQRGPGLQHLAYRVGDLSAAVTALAATGVRVLGDGPSPGAAGTRIVFLHPHDGGGVLVELVERGS